MSRRVLSPQQFDLMVTTEREVEQKRREDRAGIQCPEDEDKDER